MERNPEPLALTSPFSRTLSDQVAQQLRQAILGGRLEPGQRIVEHEIAAAMQMSRGPVRDALKILENERLVIRYPYRGAFVALLSLRDAQEIYSLREALETLALVFGIREATTQQIDELDEKVNKMAERIQSEYTQAEATDLDLEFHHTLCRISGHSRLLAAWEALSSQIRLLIMTHRISRPHDFRENSVAWHRQIVDALRNRDEAQGRQLLSDHLIASFESAVKRIKESEASPPSDNHHPPNGRTNPFTR